MAEAAPYSFDNLTQSGIIKISAKDDRNVSFTLDTFGGNTSMCVWTGAGGKPWKLGIPRKIIHQIIVLLKKMQVDPRPCREAVFLNKYEEGDGKKGYKQYGCIGFGIDENLTLFIDIAANDLQGRHMFLFRPDGRFDVSNTSMVEKDILIGNINWLIDSLQNTTNFAERLSSFKRTGGSSGGSRGGNSYGGNNRGGSFGGGNSYNKAQSQQTTFGGGPDLDSELHI